MPIAILAEDDNAVRPLVKGILQRRGYTVYDFDNGMGAFDKFQELRSAGTAADLVMTDNDMPGTDQGVSLVHAVRREEKQDTLPRTPIVMMSGMTTSKAGTVLADEAKNNAAIFISKPFASPTLITIDTAIQQAQGLAAALPIPASGAGQAAPASGPTPLSARVTPAAGTHAPLAARPRSGKGTVS